MPTTPTRVRRHSSQGPTPRDANAQIAAAWVASGQLVTNLRLIPADLANTVDQVSNAMEIPQEQQTNSEAHPTQEKKPRNSDDVRVTSEDEESDAHADEELNISQAEEAQKIAIQNFEEARGAWLRASYEHADALYEVFQGIVQGLREAQANIEQH